MSSDATGWIVASICFAVFVMVMLLLRPNCQSCNKKYLAAAIVGSTEMMSEIDVCPHCHKPVRNNHGSATNGQEK